MRYLLFVTVLSFLTLTSFACSPGPAAQPVEVSEPWVRLPAVMSGMGMVSPGALYMVIRNHGDSSDTLLQVESDAAGLAQIHLTEVDADGVASMRQVDGLDIPAGEVVELKPGSYHIMLMDMKRELTDGEMVRFVLTFAKAGVIDIEAPVRAP